MRRANFGDEAKWSKLVWFSTDHQLTRNLLVEASGLVKARGESKEETTYLVARATGSFFLGAHF